MSKLNVSGVILAGGKSRRLGFDKRRLRIGGQTILVRTIELLAGFCADTIVVANPTSPYPDIAARCVADIYPGKGVLGGLYTGLVNAAMPHCVVVAADMPFLSAPLLMHLASLAPGYDVVVPLVDGMLEPLHAVYGQTCLAAIERQLLNTDTSRIVSFFDDVRVRHVERAEMLVYDPDLLSLFNINTPEDIERARRLLQQNGLDIESNDSGDEVH